MKKKILFFTPFLFMALAFAISVSATNYTSHIHSGGFKASVAEDLPVHIDADLSDYKTRITSSFNKLTNISSNLGWSEVNFPVSKIYLFSLVKPNDSAFATASYYCETLGVRIPCSSSKQRDYVQIVFNRHHMDSSGWNYNNKYKTIIHEVGHALSLAHVDSSEGDSIMIQGKLEYTAPQTMDIDHIKHKWGN